MEETFHDESGETWEYTAQSHCGYPISRCQVQAGCGFEHPCPVEWMVEFKTPLQPKPFYDCMILWKLHVYSGPVPGPTTVTVIETTITYFYSSRLLYMLELNSNTFPWCLSDSLNRHKEEFTRKLHSAKCYFDTFLKHIVEKSCPFFSGCRPWERWDSPRQICRVVYISLSTIVIPEMINILYIKITKVLLSLHLNLYRNRKRIIMKFSDRIRKGRQPDFMLDT